MHNIAARPPQPEPGTGAQTACDPDFDLVRLKQIHRSTPYIILISVFTAVVTSMVLAGRKPAQLLAAWLGGNALDILVLSLDWQHARSR